MKSFFLILFLIPTLLIAQNDLFSEIDSDPEEQNTIAVFKTLKIVNLESTKLVAKKSLVFVVSHRFGSLKNGVDTFFGLDDAVTRLNFVYGLTENINISASRSSNQKIYQSALKYRLFNQKDNGFPLTIVGNGEITINSGLEKDNFPKLEFENRLGYVAQLLVSRKLNDRISLEIAPTLFHDNLIRNDQGDQDNTQYAFGLGGRIKITKRWSFNADYAVHLNRASDSIYNNPLSVGFDLETGGHVFQLHVSNSQFMNTNGFLSQAVGDWEDGDVFFGFNLARTF